MRTEQEIVDSANALARLFYARMGYNVREGYRFDKATHPQEVMCWDMACYAFDHIEGTPVEDALAEIEDE